MAHFTLGTCSKKTGTPKQSTLKLTKTIRIKPLLMLIAVIQTLPFLVECGTKRAKPILGLSMSTRTLS